MYMCVHVYISMCGYVYMCVCMCIVLVLHASGEALVD